MVDQRPKAAAPSVAAINSDLAADCLVMAERWMQCFRLDTGADALFRPTRDGLRADQPPGTENARYANRGGTSDTALMVPIVPRIGRSRNKGLLEKL